MKQALYIKLAILFVLLVSSPLIAAPVGEHAGEIWIDGPEETQPGTTPSRPDAAVDKTGRSIFVWAANPAVNGGSDIYLRIFPADGGAPSEPVRVNTLLLNSQRYPRVAIRSNGSFLVIWQSNEVPDGGVNEKELVRSQAFDANAQAVGSEQLLSALSTDTVYPVYADVAALREGGYVVVWKSGETSGDDPNTSIQARRIGADGVPLAEQFQVNSTTANDQNFSAVTELSDGGFFVVWGRPEVRGRRFEADGTPDGNDFQINTSTVGSQFEMDVLQHEDGRVLALWKDDEDNENSWEIRGRLFGGDLVAQGSDFRINDVITGGQQNPKAAAYGQGGFFVVWESGVSAGGDIEPNSIEGRIVTSRDQFAGPQFLVNEWTEDSQQSPGIGGKDGRIAVAWSSQTKAEFSRHVILGQFWSICGIFCDSFEVESTGE